jgi:hypothetical protein
VKQNSNIKFGTTRIVFLTKNYAIKIPCFTSFKLFLLGILGNIREYELSISQKSKQFDFLQICPVKYHIFGGLISVAPRCQPLSMSLFEDFDYEKFMEFNMNYVKAENKLDSFGLFDNKIVAIDYG